MARTLAALFLLNATCLSAAGPPAQVSSPHPNAIDITLGQSAVPLYGPWKFTIGDSPIDHRTGKPIWADPNFDDSQWENVDLTPADGSFDPVSGQTLDLRRGGPPKATPDTGASRGIAFASRFRTLVARAWHLPDRPIATMPIRFFPTGSCWEVSAISPAFRRPPTTPNPKCSQCPLRQGRRVIPYTQSPRCASWRFASGWIRPRCSMQRT